MATPRVFVSSTYYDLQHVRNDIQTFLLGLGYEAVMHDKGNIPYTQDVSLEEACYNELEACDIVVCIIGSKFGTKSGSGDYSITMSELKKAIKSRKKIYIYIQKDVYGENFTYLANKEKDFVPYHADNIKIHEFISELKNTVKNHPIVSFETVLDITNNLKQQLAGLFQHLLSQDAIVTESKTYEDLQNTANTIRELVSDFILEKDVFFNKFDSSILAINQTIRKIQSFLCVEKYNIYAPDKIALKQYLSDIGFNIIDDTPPPFDDVICVKEDEEYKYTLKLDSRLFAANDKLLDIRDKPTLEKYITFEKELLSKVDDLPF